MLKKIIYPLQGLFIGLNLISGIYYSPLGDMGKAKAEAALWGMVMVLFVLVMFIAFVTLPKKPVSLKVLAISEGLVCVMQFFPMIEFIFMRWPSLAIFHITVLLIGICCIYLLIKFNPQANT